MIMRIAHIPSDNYKYLGKLQRSSSAKRYTYDITGRLS